MPPQLRTIILLFKSGKSHGNYSSAYWLKTKISQNGIYYIGHMEFPKLNAPA